MTPGGRPQLSVRSAPAVRTTRAALLALALLLAPRAEAYVTYNRLGYVSCAACHFSAEGGGLLTPYGRSVGSAMAALKRENSPEEKRFYQGVQLRAIELDSGGRRANPFLMQADYLATAFITSRLRADTQLGPNLGQGAQSEFASAPAGWDGVALKRALVSAELDDTRSVQLGRDGAVSGLYVTDHTSFLRSRNRRGVLDYPTQLRYVHQTEKVQLLPYLQAPSFEESEANREYGAGFRGEYLLDANNSVGLTTLYANSPSLSRASAGAFLRLSQAHWNGLNAEYVSTRLNVHAGGDAFAQHVLHVRPYVAVPEWAETSLVAEWLRASAPFAENAFQFGPEVNLRLHEHLSVIGDGRQTGTPGNSDWSWYGQVFVHFEI